MTDEPLLSVEEAAAFLNVHPETLKRWVRAGRVKAVKPPGGWYRFRRTDLTEAMEPYQPPDSTPER